jgi:DNA-binding response OmpR family regulator
MSDGARPVLAGQGKFRQPKILIVDDAPTVRLMVSIHLRERGFETVLADDAETALELIERFGGGIDLVFVDISAGSTSNGLALARRLQETRPCLPLLLASSTSKKTETTRELRDRVFVKPYDVDKLAERICVLVGQEAIAA